MSEPGKALELNIQEQNQDCGCGCGGDSCSTHCGCGCGGHSCGTTWQELVLVDSPRLAEVKQLATGKICYCWTE